jgi:hypothetical protein
VNNAVARAAGLIAIAAIPVIARLTGDTYTDPVRFLPAFRLAIWICVWSTHRRQRPAVLTIRNTRVASARDRNKPLVCVSLAAEPPPTTSSP